MTASTALRHASTLLELLDARASERSGDRLYTFLDDVAGGEVSLTYDGLARQARRIAVALRELAKPGERALLLFPPGLEYITGLFGCLHAGVIAVPAYPPDPSRLERTLPRLRALIQDARATVVLTTAALEPMAREMLAAEGSLSGPRWLAVDAVPEGTEASWRPPEMGPGSLAFLQYTSGSTGTPRGVMLSHENLLHNLASIARAFQLRPRGTGVIWLPPYHDMGLIGGILGTLYAGMHTVLMSPLDVLRRPRCWLEALSRYQGNVSGGPNFAFELCVRKIPAEERQGLELGSWELAFTGAEPVRAETLERFAEAFAPCGFRREALYPCYGLAEATLLVSGPKRPGAVIRAVDAAALERNQAREAPPGSPGSRRLVGCGASLEDQRLAIVDPETSARLQPGAIGEIWLSGPSVAQGYWQRPEETEGTFHARLAGSDEERFLRTGDLGFLHEGELFITGRLKDLIILRGRNHYPQDLERTVERSHPALRPGCGAAFSVDVEGEERLVIVQEADARRAAELPDAAAAIRQALAETHEVQAHAVVLIRPGSLPKTSSGKVQRRACREAFLAHQLEPLSEWQAGSGEPRESGAAIEGRWLITWLATRLQVSPSRIDPSVPVTRHGLDSLAAVELAHEIERREGVVLPMAALLAGPSVDALEARLREARATGASSPSSASESPRQSPESADTFPLTPGQEGLWFLAQLAPESAAYHITSAARLLGPVNPEALRRALARLVERHPALRTTFGEQDGKAFQRVHPALEAGFTEEDASTWSPTELDTRLEERAQQPFDLSRGPLLRLHLFRRSREEAAVLLVLHHLVADFWSLALMVEELGTLYAAEAGGTPAALPTLSRGYVDHVRGEAARLAGPEGERLWRYWQTRLSGEVPVLELPTDRPRPPVLTYDGTSVAFRLEAHLTRALEALARAHGATLYTVLLAAFEALLHRYTGQEDFAVGTPTAGRDRHESVGVVGYFVNPVALRADLAGDPTFEVLIDRTRRTVLEAFEHQAYPFRLLVEKLQPARDASRSPLFQAMFVWQKPPTRRGRELAPFALNTSGARLSLGGLTVESRALEQRSAQTDLSLMMAEVDETLSGVLEGNLALFTPATMERMAGHLQVLLEALATSPGQRISTAPLLSESERGQLLREWSGSSVELPPLCVHQLVEAQVDRTPDAIAVLCGEEQLTYRELDRQANQLAHRLLRLGVGPESRVAVLTEPSLHTLVALLGVLKAGGAYVPLASDAPPERLSFLLRDAGASVVLTQAALASKLESGVRRILLDAEAPALAQEPDTRPAVAVHPGHLAYVVYTSGSTGEPKGVLITHRSVVNHNLAVARRFELGPADRLLQFTPIHFDAAVEEIFPPLASGATIVVQGELVPTAEFLPLIERYRLTVLSLPPAYLNEWLAALVGTGARLPPSLRLVLLGGEKIPPEAFPLWKKVGGSSVPWINVYGPTEATVTAVLYGLPRDIGDEAPAWPIGRPIPNARAYVLDMRLQLVPVGVPGELHLGGVGLARGYLGRPELTTHKFIPDPFSTESGARLYRTGDRVRWLPDGNLEFLGRVDDQVKLHGFRIEPGEIEAVLAEHPAIREKLVLVREDASGRKSLVAYVVAAAPAPTVGELRALLGRKLPAYMVPSAFVFLDALPLTPNGKVDRRALPAPQRGRTSVEAEYAAPRNELEEKLARVWAQVLGVERVGIHDNFFELGGDSILGIQIVARARQAGLLLRPLNLFQRQTVAELAGVAEPLTEAEAQPQGTAANPPAPFSLTKLNPAQIDKIARQLKGKKP